jgi:hypothetical protein
LATTTSNQERPILSITNNGEILLPYYRASGFVLRPEADIQILFGTAKLTGRCGAKAE